MAMTGSLTSRHRATPARRRARANLRAGAARLACILLLAGPGPVERVGRTEPASTPGHRPGSFQAGEDLFGAAPLRTIRIQLSPADAESLRRHPRQNVRVTVQDGDRAYPAAALHLKGRTGSFRNFDDKPALTLDFGKFVPGQEFHGLTKIHLNNSVEDPTYLNEFLGAELFRAAGLPAPRVTHALVELNGRKAGLYVLREGFDAGFLRRFFRRPDGNLYENQPGARGPGPLHRISGAETAAGAQPEALLQAVQEQDLTRRWMLLQARLDPRQFLAFIAVEVMAGHRDGYAMAANNYRIYHDPATDRFVFLPHGMDQLFGNAELPIRPHLSGPVARAALEIPAAQTLYREQSVLVFSNAFVIPRLTRMLDERAELIAAALPFELRPAFRQEATGLQQRVLHRVASIRRQLLEPDPAPLRFTNSAASLASWRAFDHAEPPQPPGTPAPDGRPALQLRAGRSSSLSWRTSVWLAPGRYRFEGRACTDGILPLSHGRNHGAGLRVSGWKSASPHRLIGVSGWTPLSVDFVVEQATGMVELICELRARRGDAWFDLGSLKLTRLD